jgi:2-octaprenylphenol hydroxylase
MPTQTDPDFDVVVAGAGMIGCTCALAIAQSGIRVALVDPGPIHFKQKSPKQGRVSAINLATENILRALGAWSVLNTERLSPFRQINVWDAASRGEITFNAADAGLTHLGHIIENDLITTALTTCLLQLDSVSCFAADHIQAYDFDDEGVRITLASRQQIKARLLLGADGTESRVRSLAGISVEKIPYNHQAIVATVTTELSHRESARQCFLDSGPLAFLPLHDNHSSIVWSCSAKRFDELNRLDDAAFSLALTKAFEHRLGNTKLVSRRSTFPLINQHASHYIAPRTALLGDAAHTIHPLAGLGANLGFADAATIAEIVKNAQDTGIDIGIPSVLRRYERRQKTENRLTSHAIDLIGWFFNLNSPSITNIRNIGLNITNKSNYLKNMLINQATGLHDRAPQNARYRSN